MVGVHFYDLFVTVTGLPFVILPIVIGFFWVRPDADRRGQPGLLWALLTLPSSWLTLLVYVAVRSASVRADAGSHP